MSVDFGAGGLNGNKEHVHACCWTNKSLPSFSLCKRALASAWIWTSRHSSDVQTWSSVKSYSWYWYRKLGNSTTRFFTMWICPTRISVPVPRTLRMTSDVPRWNLPMLSTQSHTNLSALHDCAIRFGARSRGCRKDVFFIFLVNGRLITMLGWRKSAGKMKASAANGFGIGLMGPHLWRLSAVPVWYEVDEDESTWRIGQVRLE